MHDFPISEHGMELVCTAYLI